MKGVSDHEDGSEIRHASTRYAVSPKTPALPRPQAAQHISRMVRVAIDTNAIEAAWSDTLGDDRPPVELDSPEMPGPGYDAQTRRVRAGKLHRGDW